MILFTQYAKFKKLNICSQIAVQLFRESRLSRKRFSIEIISSKQMKRQHIIVLTVLAMYLPLPAFSLPSCDTGAHYCFDSVYYTNGDEYTGEFKGQFQNGQGMYTWADGRIYVGQWIDGIQSGYGTSTWPDGRRYVGGVRNRKQHGQGTETLADGRKYVGQWRDDKMNGQGTYTWPDGHKYVGGFRDDKYHGQGTLTLADGRVYIGQWRDDKMNGHGTYTWPDGRKYVGQYRDDKYHGHGTYTWPDGRKYVGGWRNGERHGLGTVTSAEGKVTLAGYWKNGKHLAAIPSYLKLPLKIGSSGDGVAWLWRQFDALDGKEERVIPTVFGDRLHDRVIAFQRKEGLTVDGIAGLATIFSIHEKSSSKKKPQSNANKNGKPAAITDYGDANPKTTHMNIGGLPIWPFLVLFGVFVAFALFVEDQERKKRLNLHSPSRKPTPKSTNNVEHDEKEQESSLALNADKPDTYWYEHYTQEYEAGDINTPILAKAMALHNGDESKSKYEYIRLSVTAKLSEFSSDTQKEHKNFNKDEPTTGSAKKAATTRPHSANNPSSTSYPRWLLYLAVSLTVVMFLLVTFIGSVNHFPTFMWGITAWSLFRGKAADACGIQAFYIVIKVIAVIVIAAIYDTNSSASALYGLSEIELITAGVVSICLSAVYFWKLQNLKNV